MLIVLNRLARPTWPLLVGLVCFTLPSITAQTPEDDAPVELPQFTVSSDQPTRYQATDTISAGRVRTSLMDTSQSISIVTREMIEDTATFRIFDAVKYVSGVSESTLPGAIDRITLRGFQTDNGSLDGFSYFAQANMDPAIIDRIEVVKGPTSILNPSGPAGGTINLVSKSPLFRAASSVKLQLGEYDSNRVEFDSTGPVASGSALAYRLVAAAQDSEAYWENAFQRSLIVMPMLTWRLSDRTELELKLLYLSWEAAPYVGYPVDPSTGTDTPLRMFEGVPRTRSLQEKDDFRDEERTSAVVTLRSNFSDQLAMRLAGRVLYAHHTNTQITGAGASGGSINPATGRWAPGLVFSPTAPFTASPAPPAATVYTRGGNFDEVWDWVFSLQNDYALTLGNDFVGSNTVVGFAANYGSNHRQFTPVTRTPINIYNPVFGTPKIFGVKNSDNTTRTVNGNAFISEQLKVFDERVILSGNYTLIGTDTSQRNNLTGSTPFDRSGRTDIFSWGVLAKPLPNLSLFYSDSRNAGPVSFPGTPPGNFDFRTGRQQEVGAKWSLLGGKVLVSGAMFDITLQNFSFPNPAAIGVPVGTVPLLLFGDFTSKGWELEVNAQLHPRLLLVGHVSQSKYRDPNGVRQRGSADLAAGLFVRYDFQPLNRNGFYATVGIEYLGDRAGDTATGLAAGSTSSNPIYNQPSFYFPSRMLTNVGAGYRWNSWLFQVQVLNALDEEYESAALSRSLVITGVPRNVRASMTYRF